MNIAFITIGFTPLRTAGIDIVGERLVKGLLNQKHKVTVIAGRQGDQPEKFEHPGLQIIRIPIDQTHWIGFGLRAALTLRKLERENHFDIVHFWDIYFAWAYWGKFVGSLHHSFQQRIETSQNVRLSKKIYYLFSMKLAERPAMQRASGLMAVSEASRQAYLRGYNISPNKILLTRNGIDTQFFHPIENTDVIRSSLKIPSTDPVIMYSGFFTPRKGLEYLAQAMQEIQPRTWLVLTGKWDQRFQDQFDTLLGSASSRVIYAGFVPDKEMPSYFSMADLYVSSSLLEGFGLPLAEALACETPVVAANAGAVAEVVGPGGVLVPPGDYHALAQAVSELLANPQKRINLGRLGRDHLIENFSNESMLNAYIEAYKRFQKKQPNSI